jgi:hypothetical protein
VTLAEDLEDDSLGACFRERNPDAVATGNESTVGQRARSSTAAAPRTVVDVLFSVRDTGPDLT